MIAREIRGVTVTRSGSIAQRSRVNGLWIRRGAGGGTIGGKALALALAADPVLALPSLSDMDGDGMAAPSSATSYPPRANASPPAITALAVLRRLETPCRRRMAGVLLEQQPYGQAAAVSEPREPVSSVQQCGSGAERQRRALDSRGVALTVLGG